MHSNCEIRTIGWSSSCFKTPSGKCCLLCVIAHGGIPQETVLSSVFSCTTCEKDDGNGGKRLSAIVMDGTATGVPGALANFSRLAVRVCEESALDLGRTVPKYYDELPTICAFLQELVEAQVGREDAPYHRLSFFVGNIL